MKCSLLALSTYIDDELTPDRRAELDAHLVGCGRCSAGAATLREEKNRLGQLARVRVAPDSARLMLEQVGITGISDLPAPARPGVPSVEALPEQQPWQIARQRAQPSNAALPWRPRRPAPQAVAVDAASAPPSVPDVKPDVPFVSAPAEQRSWSSEPAPPSRPEMPPVMLPAATHAEPEAPPPPADGRGIHYPWVDADVPVGADVPVAGWEMAPGEDVPHREHGAAATAPLPPPPAAPPTRAPLSGGSMLWSRLRDSVAVRLTLARHADRVEDSIQIVSGATPPRGRRLPVTEVAAAAPDIVAEAGDVELTGVGRGAPVDQPTEAPVATSPNTVASAPPAGRLDDRRDAAATEPVPWNAFGASSYPQGTEVQPSAPSAPIKPSSPGRHSRAVAREQVTVATRLRRALAAMGATLREGGQAAAAGARTAVKTTRGANPDRRIITVIAAVAIVFIAALVIGHRSTSTNRAVAGAGAATSATSHASAAPTSAPAATAAPATGAPAAIAAPPTTQTFGAAGTGFQVSDIRYGQQPGFTRMVFDMGPVTGSSGSSPQVTVATTPTSVLVTLNGTLPAGVTGSPPARGVVSSVTLVSSSGGKTVYRIAVSHPVTVKGMFLSGTAPPLRLILDLH